MEWSVEESQRNIRARIKECRENFELSQEEAAKLLGVTRLTLYEWECGKRPITVAVLERFCRAYQQELPYFLQAKEEEAGFAVLLRATSRDEESRRAVMRFECYCNRLDKLFTLFDLRRSIPGQATEVFDGRSPSDLAEHHAEQSRERLGLGKAPVPHLRDILEDKEGLNIFFSPLPQNISGIFTSTARLGGCIMINAQDGPGRQLFSLTHEYAHFLFHRRKLALITRHDSKGEYELFANLFAGCFLMPRQAVTDGFYQRVGNKNKVSDEDVLILADYFAVSFGAMLVRLRQLKLVSQGGFDKLKHNKQINRLRDLTGQVEPARETLVFPKTYLHLLVKAVRNGMMTTSALAEFLDIDLWEAREIARRVLGQKPDGPAA